MDTTFLFINPKFFDWALVVLFSLLVTAVLVYVIFPTYSEKFFGMLWLLIYPRPRISNFSVADFFSVTSITVFLVTAYIALGRGFDIGLLYPGERSACWWVVATAIAGGLLKIRGPGNPKWQKVSILPFIFSILALIFL